MRYFENPRKFLKQHGLAPSKKLGQNFLINPMTARRIVSFGDFSKDDHVVEIGVGFGALTHFISEQAGTVTGVEVDRGIIRFHENENDLPQNVHLIHGDILKIDFSIFSRETGGPSKFIANLPYSISNPFIFKLIENRQHVKIVTVMLQKEVADRLTAEPSTKEYGIPTILLGCCAHVKKMLTLKPDEFFPRPKIDSVVIRIEFFPPLGFQNFSILKKIVRTAFSSRRKTILNNLSTPALFKNNKSLSKSDIKNLVSRIIEQAGLSPTARAETLHIEEFKNLAGSFEANNYS